MSDDVSQFLQQVQQLNGRRIKEDEARSKQLEEKILQERSERAARRAERARSISPQKSSPANTPPSTSHRDRIQASDGLKPSPSTSHDSPQSRRDAASDVMDSFTDYSTSPSKENDSPFTFDPESKHASFTSPSTSLPPARASPLSWQRRPNSQSPERPKSRPLSMVAAENAARTSAVASESSPAADHALTRDQIAQALSSKDPTWFRQTPDRGASSAAYRRDQVEDGDRLNMSVIRAQLPGMSDPSTSEPKSWSGTASSGRIGSPFQLGPAQILDPPSRGSVEHESRSLERSPTRAEGRMSPTRPLSPTKGVGGFVQSAMMKRSDSVKRWSVTSPPGLARADSVASNRNSLDRTGATTQSNSRPSSMIRDGSATPTSTSRPTSRHGTDEKKVDPAASIQPVADPTPEMKPQPATGTEEEENVTPPSSPSKTMDPRRWSPAKSSWLDAALKKEESPRPKPTPPPSNQPAWMVELNKAKAQKASNPNTEVTRSDSVSHKHEVKIGGLMRSAPIGTTTKPNVRHGLGGVYSPTTTTTTTATSSNRPGSASSLRGSLSKSMTDPDTAEVDASRSDASKRSSTSDSMAPNKMKPDTPPKKDFRANLKPNQAHERTGSSGNPNDFKNVLGQLRKTKTQNYVAPDELKDNILRGKSALNITGGPKRTERKDEFKEAILKKRDEFKKAQLEGKGVGRGSPTTLDKPVPESLVGRYELGKRESGSTVSSKRDSASSEVSKVDTPLTSPPMTRPSPGLKRQSAEETTKSTLRGVPFAPPKEETIAPSRPQGRAVGGGLVGRFNPGLAGLLARGPPAMASGANTEDSAPHGNLGGGGSNTGAGPQLTHMTKNRARGPRRKAPTKVEGDAAKDHWSETDSPAPANLHEPAATASPLDKPKLVGSSRNINPPEQVVLVDSSKKSDLTDQVLPKDSASKIDLPDQIRLVDSSALRSATYVKPAPRSAAPPDSAGTPGQIKLVDSSAMRAEYNRASTPRGLRDSYQADLPSPKTSHNQAAAMTISTAKPDTTKVAEDTTDDCTSQPSSPKKLDMKRMSRFLDEATPRSPQLRSDSRSPTRRAERPASQAALNDTVDSDPVVSVKDATAMFGGAAPRSPPKQSQALFDGPPPHIGRPKSPSKSNPRPLPLSPGAASPTSVSSPLRSPTKQTMEVSALLGEFFGPRRPKREYRADAAEILMSRPAEGPKIKTVDSRMFQLTGDGKKLPVPAHNERVLFEREMYVCLHSFTNAAGRKTSEVYFWAGDDVPPATVEDAQVFAGREARSLGVKLIKLSQGKESPEFLQALGGIVLTRRGSSNKYDSLAPNMLCGRRHLGQVAFDEVDFSPASLCSGFPYLITQQGRCYLWKGKGSDIDELSCARLIGMDLTLTGELTEIDDGDEPATFWNIFDGGVKPHSADHWRLKPNYDMYCGRLFCSDAASKQQILEISPFNQADLRPTNIYVLDAFFEMYIIVGSAAQPQYAAFRNACDFAQEYAILASGMEDRPFVPISTVVLEGIPRDLKSVFRKWRDADSPTVMHPATGASDVARGAGSATASGHGNNLKRGRSLRIVPLTHALQALAE